ncbi:VC0807 family protein [Lactococcus allomyrinae]|uniref:DUF3159 domain-containing protein n=1 Tax=Lactococcus allomyrinae TaxID=2419773 RepID=A0A387BG03_9LACT|nr:VC0807 family protein [Lactococcus allomyrinae]AYG00066.1 hypothetical protein D7I46_02555 [Lactococcus allomyrinae]
MLPKIKAFIQPKMLVGILINWIIPIILVALLKMLHFSDASALLLSALIPVIYTLEESIRKHKLDPMGSISVIAFAISLLVAFFSHGNGLLIKIFVPSIYLIIGLILIGSFLVKKPFLMKLITKANRTLATRAHAHPEWVKRIDTLGTLIFGVILVVHSALQIWLAFNTSTVTYVWGGRLLTLATMVICGLAAFITMRHNKRTLSK